MAQDTLAHEEPLPAPGSPFLTVGPWASAFPRLGLLFLESELPALEVDDSHSFTFYPLRSRAAPAPLTSPAGTPMGPGTQELLCEACVNE